MSVLDIAAQVLRDEAAAVLDLVDKLDGEFEKAVKLIDDSQGRVILTGMGKSGHIARKVAATMASTGTPAFFLHPAEAIHGDLGMVTRADVVIAYSNSGETAEVVNILPSIRRIGAKLIAIVGKTESTLAKNADAVLDAGVKKEAGMLGLAPTKRASRKKRGCSALRRRIRRRRRWRSAMRWLSASWKSIILRRISLPYSIPEALSGKGSS